MREASASADSPGLPNPHPGSAAGRSLRCRECLDGRNRVKAPREVKAGSPPLLASCAALLVCWMNVERTKQKNIMLIWTAAIVVGVVVQLVFGASMMPEMPAT